MRSSSSGSAVLEDVLDQEEVTPFGMRFAEKMAAPKEVIADPGLLRVYASTTYTTQSPRADDPVDDTER